MPFDIVKIKVYAGKACKVFTFTNCANSQKQITSIIKSSVILKNKM